MRLTARGLNRATLGRQLLLWREALGVAEAVRRVVALQAQLPASPYLALWNRLSDFDPADLDTAFTDRAVVRATLMRVTMHTVHADDYRAFREAVQPAVLSGRLDDARYAGSGLTVADADALVPDLHRYAARPRTGVEIDAWIQRRFGPAPGGWQRLRGYVPLLHAPTGAPWSFGVRASYVAPRSRPVLSPEAADAALPALVHRYLDGFGPASAADVAQFAQVRQGRVRVALDALGDRLERLEGPGGAALHDVRGAPQPDPDTPAPPRLMAMWDSVLLAYADRSRVIPPDYRGLVIRTNGDVLPTLLVDGQVAGVWRPVDQGIEATAFHRLPDEAWAGLEAEARALVALVAGREPRVYRRYDHWWGRLPAAAELRVLPG